ncbi:MAG TPA: dicarboxylate/amino acid:cation symporter [Flavobacteriaceae bacterium]|nr:dicarboxylate/amino acid:cation symporter [Flavobacteriaceae bacterium]
MEEYTRLKELDKYLRSLIENNLWIQVLIALFLGIVTGVILGPQVGWISETAGAKIGNWLALPGNIFLRLVQMIMIPLIFSSIILGIVSHSGEQLKKLGIGVGGYFIATTTISIIVGVSLALFFKPGKYIFDQGAFEVPEATEDLSETVAPFSDIPSALLELIPSNPLQAMLTNEMLSIVVFTILIGVAITQLSKEMHVVIMDILYAIQELCMIVVKWAMVLIPIAVFGLIAQLTLSVGVESLTGIGMYVVVVLIGLLLLLTFYMALVFIIGKRNPFSFLKHIREAQLLAFSTTSSAAVMPISMKTAEEELDVDPSVSNFLIPIGATINMDGTAIYQCISSLFIAQAYGLDLDMTTIIILMVTIVGASIGTPSIPGGGVVVLASVLTSVGIPAEGIFIIIGVERILGMFRTAINVTGDLTACIVFDRWLDPTSKDLKPDKAKPEPQQTDTVAS